MESEKLYNREILKAFLNKQIYRCVNNKYYTLGIFISNNNKFKLIDLILNEIFKQHYEKNIVKYQTTVENINIEFDNGSRIKCIIPTESCRGNRYNALAIDVNINSEIKFCVGYAKIIDYPCQFDVDMYDDNIPRPVINNKSDIIEINIE